MTDIICPVCESKITAGGQVCEVCGADLKLLSGGQKPQYACPECGSEIQETDTSCPRCGVQFAIEEQVVFQCPSCNAEVESTANVCPGCGAEFLTEEEASAADEVPKAIDSVPSIEVDDTSAFDDMAQGITTGSPETLIDEVEETLKGMDIPKTTADTMTPAPAVQQEEIPVAPEPIMEEPTVEESAEESKGERSGFFRFKFGKKKEDKHRAQERHLAAAPTLETAGPVEQRRPAETVSVRASPAVEQVDDEMKPVVEQLRELLKFTGDARIDISDGKKYLDTSVEFAKSGDSAEALRQMRLAHTTIEANIQSFFKDKMEIMRKQIEIENVTGERKKGYDAGLSNIAQLVRSNAYDKAFASVQQFQSELSPKASQFGEAKELIDNLEELLRYADEIGIDYNSSRMIFTEARKHLAVGDWSSALVLAKQSKDSLMRSIPGKLIVEMNKAKSEIIDAKINGLKVTDFIATLKEASNAYNEGKYDDSLRFMNIFRREFDRARSLASGPAAM